MRTALPPYVPPPAKSQRWRLWVLGGVVLALVVTSIVVRILQPDPPSLPHFNEQRPAYGTIHLHTKLSQLGGTSEDYITDSNDTGSVVYIKGSDQASVLDPNPTVTQFEYILSAKELWMFSTEDDMWVKTAEPDNEFYVANSNPVTMLMVSDYVPESLRKYLKVKSIEDGKVGSHTVKVYDMRLDVPAYRDSKSPDYQPWADRMGITVAKRNTTLELSVDANGVVWRMRSFSTIGTTGSNSATLDQWIEDLSTDKFQPPYPDTYYDEATGRTIG